MVPRISKHGLGNTHVGDIDVTGLLLCGRYRK